MKIFVPITLILLFSLAGCGRVSEDTLNNILEKDPAFGKALNAKKKIKSQIASLKGEMAPKIDALEAKLEEAHAEYKSKTKAKKELLHKLKSIRRLLTKKNELTLTGDEISIWNKRAAGLEKEIDTVKKTLAELRNKTYLLKTEIRILKE